MSDPNGGRPPRTRPKHKRSDPEREAREALANPEFQTALAQLQSLTPEGEPLFGFNLETKDARDQAPHAGQVEPEDGRAPVVVTAQDAAAAYVPPIEPAPGLSPRMPTGKVKLASGGQPEPKAADGRRQATQPSLRKGGSGSPPPCLVEEPDSPWATDAEPPEIGGAPTIQAGERVEMPSASKAGVASKMGREPSRRRHGIALATGALLVLVVGGVLVRANGHREGAVETSGSGRASASSAPRGAQSAGVAASASAASTTTTNAAASAPPMGNASAPPKMSATPIATPGPSATTTPRATVTAPTPTSMVKGAGTQTAGSTIPESEPTASPMSTPPSLPVAPAPTTSPSTHSTASSFGRRLDDH